jgi:hypothetical protein
VAPPPALSVHTLPGAVDAVLALDNPRMLADACALREFTAGHRFEVGPFQVDTWALPHFDPNAGVRLTADGHVLAYMGDVVSNRSGDASYCQFHFASRLVAF